MFFTLNSMLLSLYAMVPFVILDALGFILCVFDFLFLGKHSVTMLSAAQISIIILLLLFLRKTQVFAPACSLHAELNKLNPAFSSIFDAHIFDLCLYFPVATQIMPVCEK